MSSLADFQGPKEEQKQHDPDDCDDETSFISTSNTMKMPTRNRKRPQAE